jgi:hypothetical protein
MQRGEKGEGKSVSLLSWNWRNQQCEMMMMMMMIQCKWMVGRRGGLRPWMRKKGSKNYK